MSFFYNEGAILSRDISSGKFNMNYFINKSNFFIKFRKYYPNPYYPYYPN